MVFGIFKKKQGFLPIEEIGQKEEEKKVVGIFEKKQAKEKREKRQIFEKKVRKFRAGAAKFSRRAEGFGAAEEDIFFGAGGEPRRRKRRTRQQTEDNMFGDMGFL